MKTPGLLHREVVGRLGVAIYRDSVAAARAVARECATYLGAVLAARGAARLALSAGPAMDEFFTMLAAPPPSAAAVDWRRVTVFQSDDGGAVSAADHLRRHLLDRVPVGCFHALGADPDDADADGYAAQLGAEPLDLACLALGEDGRLAGNDPAVARFDADRRVIRIRPAAGTSGGVTLTLPVFRSARRLCVLSTGPAFSRAVYAVLRDAITTACPASMLRLHPAATLHLDTGAAALAFGPLAAAGKPPRP